VSYTTRRGATEGGADAEALGQVLQGLDVGAADGASQHKHHFGQIPEAFGLEGGDGAEDQNGGFLGGDAADPIPPTPLT
jgi:hypothetical protein